MPAPLIIKNDITINASASRVWDVLTNPVHTRKYMHGCALVTDWKVGSPLLWNAVWEGKEMTFVKGNVVAIAPEKHLVYTTIDATGNMEDVPANYATVTYSMEGDGSQTVLLVTQGDYAHIAGGEQKYNDALAEGGWHSILEQIKQIAEE